MLYTVGFNYYNQYILPISVTEGLSDLNCLEAGDYYKIIYIKTGPCHFMLNGKEFILTGACAIYMNEKDKIEIFNVSEESAKILWFKPSAINSNFNYEFLSKSSKSLTIQEQQDLYYILQFSYETETTMKILSLHTLDSTGIEYKIQLLKDLLAKQDTLYWPCRSRSYLFEILFYLARQEDEKAYSHEMLKEGHSRMAIDVIYYLQSSYNQKITIEKLAENFHTNRTTLLNDFKKYTGQSVAQYLNGLRLRMASTLLRDTNLTVDEICDRTGFGDISYFSKVFKKKLYYTPSEYRRINK